MEVDAEKKLLAQSLLAASARHDVNAVRNLLRNTSANVQDDETGFTPLHAAIAACGPHPQDDSANGTITTNGNEASDKTTIISPEVEDAAAETVTLLLENGAIWNDLDKNGNTPGCVAHQLGLKKLYQLMVSAGVRAELLFQHLEKIEGVEEEEEVEAEEGNDGETEKMEGAEPTAKTSGPLRPAGVDAVAEPPMDYIDHWDSNADFLRSSLRFTDTQLLDSSSNAVMMDWEDEIMRKHADRLLPRPGMRAMNIGHGMGIVDTAIQTHSPAEHHIVEAHPAVLQQLRKNGWLDKPGVVVHEGRWQDVLPKLIAEGCQLDAIYYDTFAESYNDLKELFSEHVIGLLAESGRFGFYNGLGADRQVCYDIYTDVAELDLSEAGFQTTWEEIPVPTIDWNGVRRPYWNVDIYRLPTCTLG